MLNHTITFNLGIQSHVTALIIASIIYVLLLLRIKHSTDNTIDKSNEKYNQVK